MKKICNVLDKKHLKEKSGNKNRKGNKEKYQGCVFTCMCVGHCKDTLYA